MNVWVLLTSLISFTSLCLCSSNKIDLLMPHVAPQEKDTYLCVSKELTENDPPYITKFVPHSTKEIAHHILVYACELPGVVTEEKVWSCGEMATNDDRELYKTGPICRGVQNIIYAWAMDAPILTLPDDVAFNLGAGTNKKYLVMQVHYANVDTFLNGGTDDSGIILHGQHNPVTHLAGVYLVATGGMMRKNSMEHFEAACEIKEDIEMIPFAYRTHAHKLGLVNSGYLVRNDPIVGDQDQTWTEIGRRSPQLPQMFFPVSKNMTIKKGDIVAARCTMHNTKNHRVFIGSTGDDEMCNFYIMYYTNRKDFPKNNVCFTNGPPNWYFEDFHDSKDNVLDISKIPSDINKIPQDQIEMLSKGAGHMKHMSHNMKHMSPNMNSMEEQMENDSELKENDSVNDLKFYMYLKKLLMSKY